MNADHLPHSQQAWQHQTVLREQAVAALITAPGGRYVDGTFGRGGHARLILERLAPGRGELLVIDKDPAAIAEAQRMAGADARLQVRRGSFAQLSTFAADLGWPELEGVLLDLGVSSPQLDDPGRGFSFLREGPLDMRMDPDTGLSAAQWLAQAEEAEIADVLWRYGEERFSRRIARAVVEQRQERALETTTQLAQLIDAAVPFKEKHKHPATRSFQAIRIFINGELDDLESALVQAAQLLAPGGRLVVISFHSLEDRLVKRFMRRLAKGPQLPKGLPVREADVAPDYRLEGKSLRAEKNEVAANPRARSAIMRVLEKKTAG